ncbi:unnamed protein product [Owenia fusiformis]|uniref:Uncharacterized protein n=1 Tax=Owenia fusiformis TaxID=6347 RepID=A0A8J1USM9_OWEFU|nr:unnamed protein product [Owenia fusiformis]
MKIAASLFLGLALFVCSEACSVTVDNKSTFNVGWQLTFAWTNWHGRALSNKKDRHNCDSCLPRDLLVTWNNRNCKLYVNCIDNPNVEVNIYRQSSGQWVMNLRNMATGETSYCNMPAP